MIYLVIEQNIRFYNGTEYRAFNNADEAIAYMKEIAESEDSDWVLMTKRADIWQQFPRWKSKNPISQNTYDHDELKIRVIDLD